MTSHDLTAPHRRRFDGGLRLGLVLMGTIVLIAVLAPPLLQERAAVLGERAADPSWAHPLGTDDAGHDMLARTLVATRLTLLLAAAATAIAVVAGVLGGTGVWMLPGRAREVALRVVDGMVAFPGMLLALIVAAVLGAGPLAVVAAIGVAGVPYFARLTSTLASALSRTDYVAVARALGVPRRRLFSSHLLPNMAEPVLVLGATSFAQSLTAISALSFVGLGVQSPQYDWGSLLGDSLPALLSGRPLQALGPAGLVVLTGIAAVLIGDGLASAADPRRSRGLTAAPAAPTPSPASAEVPVRPTDTAREPLLEVRGLRVRTRSGTPLVHGISFALERGEILGIVGESGSGKSLTAMTIARLLDDALVAEAETLTLAGLDLRGPVEDRRLAQEIGVVFQDPGTTFNPALRIGTQLAQAPRVARGLSTRQSRALITDMLRAVRITEPERRMRQLPHELSGGMRQRAMIAGVLANQPSLVIADEPTTALDVTVQAEILRELRRINREHGTTVMMISHDIGVVRALCDRVLVMSGGSIVEELPATCLDLDHAAHPYTRRLLAATPSLAGPADLEEIR